MSSLSPHRAFAGSAAPVHPALAAAPEHQGPIVGGGLTAYFYVDYLDVSGPSIAAPRGPFRLVRHVYRPRRPDSPTSPAELDRLPLWGLWSPREPRGDIPIHSARLRTAACSDADLGVFCDPFSMGQIPTVPPAAAAQIAGFVLPGERWVEASSEHLSLYSLGTALLHIHHLRTERDRIATLPSSDPHQLSVAESQVSISTERLGRRFELSPPQVSFLLTLTARGHLDRRRLDQVRSGLTAARLILD